MMRWVMALPLVACASSATATYGDGAVPAPRDVTCSGERSASRVESVDPATGCPSRVLVEHRWAAPRVCERLEPACGIDPACRFSVRLVAPALPGCRAPGVDHTFTACRCEFGVIECAGGSAPVGDWPGCVANNTLCYDCDG